MRPKHELIKTQIYQSRDGATAAIAYYTETFYNCSRRHSHAGAFSPEQVAATHKSRTQGPLNPSISTGADGMRRREQANAHRVDWCIVLTMPGHKAPELARREQILNAAFRVALRERLSGLRIRTVAVEAGLSSGLVLFHFKTKDTLIAALLEWLLDSTRMLSPQVHVRGDASAAACLGTLIGAEARRISTDRRRSELFFDFWVAGTRNARLRVQMRAALTNYRHEFRELAAEMLASRGHRFPGATADGIAAAAVSFVHGCAIQAVIDPEGFDLSATIGVVEALADRAFVSSTTALRLGPRGASSSRAVTRKPQRRRRSKGRGKTIA